MIAIAALAASAAGYVASGAAISADSTLAVRFHIQHGASTIYAFDQQRPGGAAYLLAWCASQDGVPGAPAARPNAPQSCDLSLAGGRFVLFSAPSKRHPLDQQVVRVGRRQPGSKNVSVGPILMSYRVGSGGVTPQTMIADGSIWLYDCTTTKGGEVLRLSAVNGDLLQTTTIPQVGRPIISADADGFFMGADNNSPMGNDARRGVYFAPVGARTARLIFSAPAFVLRMVGAAHTMNVLLDNGSAPGNFEDVRFTAER